MSQNRHDQQQPQALAISKTIDYGQPIASSAELKDGALNVSFVVPEAGAAVAFKFSIGAIGQKGMLDALSGGLEIAREMPKPPKEA